MQDCIDYWDQNAEIKLDTYLLAIIISCSQEPFSFPLVIKHFNVFVCHIGV